MRPLRQLPLPFPAEPRFGEADFLEAPSNAEALAWLGRVADWPDRRLVLWGEAGCGKTHLLRVWAARTRAAMLDRAGLREPPEIAGHRAVAVDAADVAGSEPALLHLLNTAAETRIPVLLASRLPPAAWALDLADLASRLRATLAVRILPPEDALLRILLARLLAERQLAVAPEIQDWLLLRLPRTPAAMRAAAARLDAAALAGGSGVTRAVARLVADELGPATVGPDEDAGARDRDRVSSPPRSLL